MLDVVSVGRAVYDLFVYTDKASTEIIRVKHPRENTEHIAYPTGAKILIERACFDVGGGATNTATSFSRLGLRAGCVSSVGKDFYGRQILECLKRERVRFIGRLSSEHTDFSIILDSKGHDRTILTYTGAGSSLGISKKEFGRLNARCVFVSSTTGSAFSEAASFAAAARKNGAVVAFNPSTYLAKKGYSFLKGILGCTDILVLNKEEAMHVSNESEVSGMLSRLSGYGPATVIVTDGAKGAYALAGGSFFSVRPHKGVKAFETTGAGDAFASGFVAGMLRNSGVEFSLKLAVCNAESVISHFGAHNLLLSWREAASIIKKRPVKVLSGISEKG